MDMNTFVVANPHKCIGCKACEIACAVAHLDISVAVAGAVGAAFLPRLSLVQSPRVTMPIQCRQCEDAPCATVCPAGAIACRDGAVAVDSGKCFGCKTCLLACPFGAMDMAPETAKGQPVVQEKLRSVEEGELKDKERLVAHKCDLCAGRSGGPACVEACPARAFVVVDPRAVRQGVASRRTAAAASLLCAG